MDVRWLRSQMALVSQTGVLGHHSFADNLLMGDSSRLLTNECLEDVTRLTQLYDFIKSLPKVGTPRAVSLFIAE